MIYIFSDGGALSNFKILIYLFEKTFGELYSETLKRLELIKNEGYII
jgi:hypothetical protein